MYKILQANKGHIGTFQRALSNPTQQVLLILSNFTQLDEFLHRAIVVGNVFYFRDMLKRSHEATLKRHAPVLQEWMLGAARAVNPAEPSTDTASLGDVGLDSISRMLCTLESLKVGHVD